MQEVKELLATLEDMVKCYDECGEQFTRMLLEFADMGERYEEYKVMTPEERAAFLSQAQEMPKQKVPEINYEMLQQLVGTLKPGERLEVIF